jgi:uncharacterized protein YkwD
MKPLRHTLLLLPVLACSLALASPASAAKSSTWSMAPIAHASAVCANTDTRPGDDVSENALGKSAVCLINKQRARRGLRKLRLNSRLSQAAQRHTVDMVKRNYFDHVSKSGADIVDRLTRTGYMRGARSWTVGENLAWGSGSRSTPREIVSAWMESPGHRANILQRRFREIGIGVVFQAPRSTSGAAATYTTTFGARS